MIWLALARLLLALAANLVAMARERKLIEAGEAQAFAKQVEASLALLDKTNKARARAGADFDERGGVPDDNDPNLRD